MADRRGLGSTTLHKNSDDTFTRMGFTNWNTGVASGRLGEAIASPNIVGVSRFIFLFTYIQLNSAKLHHFQVKFTHSHFQLVFCQIRFPVVTSSSYCVKSKSWFVTSYSRLVNSQSYQNSFRSLLRIYLSIYLSI